MSNSEPATANSDVTEVLQLVCEYANTAVSSALEVRKKEASAAALQRTFRGHLARENTRALVHEKRKLQTSSAVQIQSTYRGHRARKEVEAMRKAIREEEASRVREFFYTLRDDDIPTFDDRTKEEKARGEALAKKYIRLGPPRFSSDRFARAFLQTAYELERRSYAVRRAIEDRIRIHTSHLQRVHRFLLALHQQHLAEKKTVTSREWRMRGLVLEEEEMHRSAIIQLSFADIYGELWAETYAGLCREAVQNETDTRFDIGRQETHARLELACQEAKDRHTTQAKTKSRSPSPTRHHPNGTTISEISRITAQNPDESGLARIDLRTRMALMRLESQSVKAEHAAEVRHENQYCEDLLRSLHVARQTTNFAKAVKLRDEFKARRKFFHQQRQQQLDTLRERVRVDQLASRRAVHEARFPNERDVFERLLTTPARLPPVKPRNNDDVAAQRQQREASPSKLNKSATKSEPSPSRREKFNPSDVYGAQTFERTVASQTSHKKAPLVVPSPNRQLQEIANSRTVSPPRKTAEDSILNPVEERLLGLLLKLHIETQDGLTPSHQRIAYVSATASPPSPIQEKNASQLAQLRTQVLSLCRQAQQAIVADDLNAADAHLIDASREITAVNRNIRQQEPSAQTPSPKSENASRLETSVQRGRVRPRTLELPAAEEPVTKDITELRCVVHHNMAVLARKQGRLRLALAHMHEVVQLEESIGEHSVASLLNTAAILTQMEEAEAALQYCRRATELLLDAAAEDLKTILVASQQATQPASVTLRHPGLIEHGIKALHNTAIAQSIRRDAIGIGSIERHSARATHRAALKLSRTVLGVTHPVTTAIEQSAATVARSLVT